MKYLLDLLYLYRCVLSRPEDIFSIAFANRKVNDRGSREKPSSTAVRMTGAPELSRNNGIPVGRMIRVSKFEERFEIATNKTVLWNIESEKVIGNEKEVKNNDRVIRIKLQSSSELNRRSVSCNFTRAFVQCCMTINDVFGAHRN